MVFIDPTGDTTYYYSKGGTYLGVTYDKKANGISTVSNVAAYAQTVMDHALSLAHGKTKDGSKPLSSDAFAEKLRGFGKTYMVDDMWAYNDANNNVTDDVMKGLSKEFGTNLYENKSGEISTGKENYEGNWTGVSRSEEKNVGGQGAKFADGTLVSEAHLHTNVGENTPKGPGQPYPSKTDWTNAPRGKYWNAVISNKQIRLYKYVKEYINRRSNSYYNTQKQIKIQRYPFKPIK